jgi:hypothetical protein
VDAQNAISQDAAREVGADLSFDESSDWGAERLRACHEALDLFTDCAMKECLLGG